MREEHCVHLVDLRLDELEPKFGRRVDQDPRTIIGFHDGANA
jgi:hypothetical protein